jgi:hypothetical protein
MNAEDTSIANWDLSPWAIQSEVMFVVVIPVIMETTAFYNVTFCIVVEIYKLKEEFVTCIFRIKETMTTETSSSFNMSVHIYHTTWH